jgi:CDP-diacylglycerol---glycerol-3-phosphate 3-phosphatidyltransferase
MLDETAAVSDVLRYLRWRWVGVVMLSLLLLGGGYVHISSRWEIIYAQRWLFLSGITTIYLTWTLWINLPANHPAGHPNTIYPSLGLPNLVTYWRGFCVACTTGFLFSPRPLGELLWLPGLLYSIGILPDYLDGYLARITRRSTLLGENLDVAVDSLAVLTGTLLAVFYGQVPVWYLLVGLARYFYLFGLWLRRIRGKPVYDLPPNLGRRALAGAQMGFTMVILWPLFGPPATHVAAVLFAIPFLFNFARDYMFASGVLKPNRNNPRPILPPWATRWLPLGLRLAVGLGLSVYMIPWILNLSSQVSWFAIRGVSHPELLTWLILGLSTKTLVFVCFGIMGRTASILALCLLGFYAQLQASFPALFWLAAVSAMLLLFLGSGALSLWQPEEELLTRRAGEAA